MKTESLALSVFLLLAIRYPIQTFCLPIFLEYFIGCPPIWLLDIMLLKIFKKIIFIFKTYSGLFSRNYNKPVKVFEAFVCLLFTSW